MDGRLASRLFGANRTPMRDTPAPRVPPEPKTRCIADIANSTRKKSQYDAACLVPPSTNQRGSFSVACLARQPCADVRP